MKNNLINKRRGRRFQCAVLSACLFAGMTFVPGEAEPDPSVTETEAETETETETEKTITGSESAEESETETLESDVKGDGNGTGEESQQNIMGGSRAFMREMTADEIVSEMGTGWNLGNVFETTGMTTEENPAQNSVDLKELIRSVHDLGFNTIRIPVTWDSTINDENGYSVDEEWMNRVEDIVDYAIQQDMYVVIDVHDGGSEESWLKIDSEQMQTISERYQGLWRTIATRFKDYDEHLIFESMNMLCGYSEESTEISDTAQINKLNQIFVDTVRSTGSNNEKRWLAIPGRAASINNVISGNSGFVLPEDSATNRLFVSVHYQDFAFNNEDVGKNTTFSLTDAKGLEKTLSKLQKKYLDKGIPVLLSEYECVDKNNTVERAYYAEILNSFCKRLGIVPVYYDGGAYDVSEETRPEDGYGNAIIDRKTGEPVYKEITDAIVRGISVLRAESEQIVKGPDVCEAQEITFVTTGSKGRWEGEKLVLRWGEYYDISCNTICAAAQEGGNSVHDLVLWKSENPSIVTVSGGRVRARGIGTTHVTAYSQSGSTLEEMTVTVIQSEYEKACTKISFAQKEYSMEEGDSLWLMPEMSPEDTDCYLSYFSSDEDVVMVNTVGKVTAVAPGNAYVIATASNGVTQAVRMSISEKKPETGLNVALNICYNDAERGYIESEISEPVEITGDGEYTLTFDCEEDLSAEARNAGVSFLTNFDSIYIEDYDVLNGQKTVSDVTACEIIYRSVVVDGQELTITEPDQAKNAITDSGVFDTEGPVSSREASVVEEVVCEEQVANFKGIENPKSVTVTFELTGLTFRNPSEEGTGGGETETETETANESGTETEAETETESGAPETEDTIKLDVTTVTPGSFSLVSGEKSVITAALTENGEGVEPGKYDVVFVSSDEAIAYVNPEKKTVIGEDGSVSCSVTAGRCPGTAKISVLAPDGSTTAFFVKVTEKKEEETTGKEAEQTLSSEEQSVEESIQESIAQSEEEKRKIEESQQEEQKQEETRNRIEVIMLALLVGFIVLGMGGIFLFVFRSGKR